MNRRPGVTLLEVLVSIFIMGIGMIALLTLFPLGALQMAQAIRDSRINDAAAEAAALANAFGVRNDANSSSTSNTVSNVFTNYLSAGWVASAPAADPTGPGYPVYVDPYYAILNGSTLGTLGSFGSSPYTGTGSTPGILRCSTTYVGGGGLTAPTPPASESPGPTTPSNWAARYFTLKDDTVFQPNGTPVGYTGSTVSVQRGGGYTWAYLLRRPKAGSGAQVELYVVVYAGRSVQVAAGETTYQVGKVGSASTTAASPGDNAVDMVWSSGAPPNVRRGSWLLDTSFEQTASSPTAYGSIHGHFYRVVNVSGSASPLTLEIEPPLRPGATTTSTTTASVNAMVVMENVVEVTYKGTGWQP